MSQGVDKSSLANFQEITRRIDFFKIPDDFYVISHTISKY